MYQKIMSKNLSNLSKKICQKIGPKYLSKIFQKICQKISKCVLIWSQYARTAELKLLTGDGRNPPLPDPTFQERRTDDGQRRGRHQPEPEVAQARQLPKRLFNYNKITSTISIVVVPTIILACNLLTQKGASPLKKSC